MKKIFITGLMSILIAGISFAQMPRIGVTAGLNASNINGTGNKNKAGLQAGLVADFSVIENFSVIPELLFSQRGYSNDLLGGATSGITLNYIQLPVNAAYKFGVGNGSKVLVFAGPYFGYGISATDAVFGSTGVYNRFDFGFNAGAGYEFEKIFFKLQVNPGLINISHSSVVKSKNINVAVSAGYFFN